MIKLRKNSDNNSGITLTNEQEKLLDGVLDKYFQICNNKIPDRIVSFSGLAGTGKTTLIGFIANILHYNNRRIAFMTYTGKASVVLRNKLNEINALQSEDYCGTIHSLIYIPKLNKKNEIVGWRLNSDGIQAYDCIIIDEASMIGKDIFTDLVNFEIPIIAIGDHNQLPPIGTDNFNLVENPDFKLETIHRQALENPIIQVSKIVREEGKIPFCKYKNIAKMREIKGRKIIDKFYEKFATKKHSIILTGRNTDRNKININIRKIHNFYGIPKIGEKLICLKNQKSNFVFNGQHGILRKIDKCGLYCFKLTVEMEGQQFDKNLICIKDSFGQDNYNEANNLCNDEEIKADLKSIKESTIINLFDFGYAITVWKAQGSEWDNGLFYDRKPFNMNADFYARYLYTGVTRFRNQLLVIGDE